jgi:hypothetical protein
MLPRAGQSPILSFGRASPSGAAPLDASQSARSYRDRGFHCEGFDRLRGESWPRALGCYLAAPRGMSRRVSADALGKGAENRGRRRSGGLAHCLIQNYANEWRSPREIAFAALLAGRERGGCNRQRDRNKRGDQDKPGIGMSTRRAFLTALGGVLACPDWRLPSRQGTQSRDRVPRRGGAN